MTKILTIEISQENIRLSSIVGETIINSSTSKIEGVSVREKKDSLSKTFKNSSFLNNSFDEMILSWESQQATIVPSTVFEDSISRDIFKLCFGEVREDYSIDFNRIAELSVVNVYEIPDWVKSFFVMKFPRIIIQHGSSHTLRTIIKSNAFNLKINLITYSDFFHLTIVKHNELELNTTFSYQSVEDIIYHLTFTLQQKELLNQKGSIELCQGLNSDRETLEKVKEGLLKLSEYKQISTSPIDNFTINSQLLCV